MLLRSDDDKATLLILLGAHQFNSAVLEFGGFPAAATSWDEMPKPRDFIVCCSFPSTLETLL
jgi:hypothetical protein